jgi:hypothetical protein
MTMHGKLDYLGQEAAIACCEVLSPNCSGRTKETVTVAQDDGSRFALITT